MNDLTEGPILRHLIRMAIPMGAGMLFQTLYYLVDLYFVARLGDAAIAGVSAAGAVQFIVMAATQVLGVGTLALIAQAIGRKDLPDATLVFNQSLFLSIVCGVVTLVLGLLLASTYMRQTAADEATMREGVSYLRFFIPGLASQFALITLGSALRGAGVAKPGMVVQIATVVLNAILAPILIAGWGTGRPLGTAGAGLATGISVFAGVVMLWVYFLRSERTMRIDPTLMKPRTDVLKRLLTIGLPSGGEFAMFFIFTGVMYLIIRPFGATAQAGYGLGTRIMQSILLPAMAVAFATSPVAGQNVGARKPDRVRETFSKAALLGGAMMFLAMLICQWQADRMLSWFTHDAAVIAVGTMFLHIASLNFVAQGLIFTCSGMFQSIGNTIPSLISSASRLITFILPALWLTRQPGFSLKQVWWLSVATVTLQAVMSVLMLRREFDRKLGVMAAAPPTVRTTSA
jgi:putative MATE family efflux protein